MEQAGQLHPVPEQHTPSPGLSPEARQLPVVLEPEPAEHLDHDGRQHHETDQNPEPEHVPAAVKFRGHPHVRAPVDQEGTDPDDRESQVHPGVR